MQLAAAIGRHVCPSGPDTNILGYRSAQRNYYDRRYLDEADTSGVVTQSSPLLGYDGRSRVLAAAGQEEGTCQLCVR